MNSVRFTRSHLTALLCLVVAGALGLAGQAKPTNLFKEVMDRKDKIVWKNAPANAIPPDVCMILQACAGAPDKLIALPKVTEAGKQVARGLFWSRTNDAKKADVVILLRQTPTDAYFFAAGRGRHGPKSGLLDDRQTMGADGSRDFASRLRQGQAGLARSHGQDLGPHEPAPAALDG